MIPSKKLANQTHALKKLKALTAWIWLQSPLSVTWLQSNVLWSQSVRAVETMIKIPKATNHAMLREKSTMKYLKVCKNGNSLKIRQHYTSRWTGKLTISHWVWLKLLQGWQRRESHCWESVLAQYCEYRYFQSLLWRLQKPTDQFLERMMFRGRRQMTFSRFVCYSDWSQSSHLLVVSEHVANKSARYSVLPGLLEQMGFETDYDLIVETKSDYHQQNKALCSSKVFLCTKRMTFCSIWERKFVIFCMRWCSAKRIEQGWCLLDISKLPLVIDQLFCDDEKQLNRTVSCSLFEPSTYHVNHQSLCSHIATYQRVQLYSDCTTVESTFWVDPRTILRASGKVASITIREHTLLFNSSAGANFKPNLLPGYTHWNM